jgi:serine-type D-Ala-D-Ala carboxypeptidase/endopeptidase (penicillin-binding protein 4)
MKKQQVVNKGRISMSLGLSAAMFLCVFGVATTVPQVRADTGSIPPAVQLVINGHRFPDSSYALLVQEVGAPQAELSINADRALNPASTMKVLTTLAALERLGPHYTWNTDVFALGTITDGTLNGDLLIRGGGDPFLVEEHLRSLLKTLQRRGVQRITGELVMDANLFAAEVSTGSTMDNQAGRAYNVLPHALISNFQVVTFHFYPHGNGREVIIRADPELPNLVIDNRLRQQTGACTGFQRGVSFSEERNRNTVVFSGSFPSACSEYSMARAVLDAPQYTYGLFRQLWRELGGEFDGGFRLAGNAEMDYTTMTPLARHESPPLGDVIKSVNKFSNNMMTRHLLLSLALQHADGPATVGAGVAAIVDYLQSVGIDPAGLHIDNGSGLSREARLSASQLAAMLQRAYRIPNMPEFMASLPLSGLDGTMQSRLTSANARGRVHVKTGSLSGVASIAGYVHAHSGRRFIVVAMVNHPDSDTGPGQELGDALMRWALGL